MSLDLDLQLLRSFRPAKVFPLAAPLVAADFDVAGSQLLTATADDSLTLYCMLAGSPKKSLLCRKYGVTACRLRWNCALLAGNKLDDAIRYCSLHDNAYLRYFRGHRSAVTCLEVAATAATDCFMSASAESIRLWDVRTACCQGMASCEAAGGPPAALAIDGEGAVFAAAAGGLLRLYDLRSWQAGPFASYACNSSVKRAAFCGSDLLLSGAGGQHWLIDSYEGYCKGAISGCAAAVPTAGSGGPFLLGANTEGIALYAANGSLAGQLESATPVDRLAVSPAYCTIVSGGAQELAFWIPAGFS